MRLYLCVGHQEVMSGYTVIDPASTNENEQYNFKNIDRFVCDGEAEQILAPDILDYLQINEFMDVLSHYVRKLKHGGRIIIGGTDLIEVSKGIMNGNLSMVDANLLLHGKQDHTWAFKSSQVCLSDLSNVLVDPLGLRIMKRRINDYKFIVDAVRE